MTRIWLLVTMLGLGCGGTAAFADDEKKSEPGKLESKLGKIDRAKVFEKLDADSDGKLFKDEFKKFTEIIKERLKNSGKGEKLEKIGDRLGDQLIDRWFNKADSNGDGSISKEEFEKMEFPGITEQIRRKKKDSGGN